MLRRAQKRGLFLIYQLLTICLVGFLSFSPLEQIFYDIAKFRVSLLPDVSVVHAVDLPAIKVESFDVNVTSDASTFSLLNDVGDTDSAFIKLNAGTRKVSAGPTGSTANTAPDIGSVGLVLTNTDEITVQRVDSTEVKVMGEVWRYEGTAGASHEFIVRDRVEVTLSSDSSSVPISGITDVDNVIPFLTGYTVNDGSDTNWEYATIAVHMDDSDNLVVSRNNSGTTATVYVDVVEFTGSSWKVCHGYSGSHDLAEETVTLNTDSDGQGGSVCDVGDWSTATIIQATMEGDSTETGISDTLALVRPGATGTSTVFDIRQDTNARNDGEAWIQVLQNDDLVVNRASEADAAEGNGTYGTVAWPAGASNDADVDTLSLEWFSDSSGTGGAHMRGGLHARIATTSPAVPTIYSDGDGVDSGDYDSTNQGNFEGEITFAATPSGVVYEAGGTGTGAFVGYNDSGNFIVRAGNGGSVTPTDAARIVVTPGEYDFSGRTGTLSWNFYPSTDSVDLSFDEDSNGSIDYTTSATAAAAWANWSGGDAGFVGNGNTSIAGSEITSGFDFNGTIDEVRFTQDGGGDGLFISHWIHRSGNTVGVEYGVVELGGLLFDNVLFGFDTLVSATSTQIVSADVPTTDLYVGGSFVIQEGVTSRNVTSISISESGTVDGSSGLSNIELWYDVSTTTPYTCTEHSFDGNETQFGSTDSNGFSGADGVSSFSDTVAINTTRSLCVYPVMTVTDSAHDGETINISVADPATDVVTTGGGSVGGPSTPQTIEGTTLLRNAELTQTSYRWLEDDGVEGSASAVESEGTPATGFTNGVTRRVRFQIDAAGSTSSFPTTFQLDYATKTAATCAELSNWVDVGDSGGQWNMSPSQLTEGANTTNIATINGGLVDPVGLSTFLTPNGGQRETSSQTGSLTLADDEFVELEFAVEPTSAAIEGTTYCFRTSDAGAELRNYSAYAEGTVSADILVSVSGAQVATLDSGSTAQYVGGTFVVSRIGAERAMTSVTLSETGTVDASANIANVVLEYDLDTTNPYDCASVSNDGDEITYGATDADGFSAADGVSVFTGSVLASSTQTICLYAQLDVGVSANDGETINIEISDPSVDVVVTGSSVGPSSLISPTGSTTIAGPIIAQTGYHWRSDDDSETAASSATGGAQDTPLGLVAKETLQRLRIQVNNEGSVSSAGKQYRLEAGTKVSTCDAIGSWTDVGTAGGAFEMSDSVNLTNGNDTTDVSLASSGEISNPIGQTFLTPNGGQRDTASETGSLTLTAAQFTELEFAIEATVDAGDDTTYCFRLSDAGSPLEQYSVYAELTTREKQDFFIQRGTAVITGTSLTINAGASYTAPYATTTAFVRITNAHITGAANDLGTNGQNADDVTAYISNQSDITTSFTIERPSTAQSNTRVSWEIIEFIGLAGSDNEIQIRGVGEVNFSATEFTDTGAATDPVTDDDAVVVFITGQSNNDTGTGNYNDGLFTATWNSGTSQPEFERGDADSSADLGYAVVEFVGANWQVQRVEHTYTASGAAETELISAVTAVSQAFIHAQKRVGEGLSSIDEGGHLVYMSSVGAVTFELHSTAQTPADHTSIAWVIENTQTGDGALAVYRSDGDLNDPDPEPAVYIVPIGATVNTTNASIFGNNITDGTGTTYPRLHTGFTIASSTDYEIYRSDTNNDMSYTTEVLEWPVAEVSVRQNYYRFYVDNDLLDPTDPWPVGVDDLGENTSITSNDNPLAEGERVRIRMSLAVNNATLPEQINSFKLQYGRQDTTCSAISEVNWTDLGDPSSGAVWRGFDAAPVDGTELATTTPATGRLNLSVSDVAGTYEEQNDSAVNPYAADIGEDIEYDWLIEHNGATQRSDYCFRMVNSDGSLLDGYNNYPTLRTTGYTPIMSNWRWYDDATSTTPATDLAAENVAPIDVANENEIKLRISVEEVESASGAAIKFALQYSERSDFASGVKFVTSTSSCKANSLWCYVDAAGVDNDLIDEAVISDTDACVGGVGAGCGTHNEIATSTNSTLVHPSLGTIELEFAIKNAGARANAVYYFRLVEVSSDDVLDTDSTYPSLIVAGPQLTFTLQGITQGVSSEGVVADVQTTPTAIPFGSVPLNTEYEAIYRLNIDTTATEGYRMLMYARQPLLNSYGEAIPFVTGTNASPTGWSSGCDGAAIGCFGYHTGDDVLEGGSTRFSPDDSYAALSTTVPEEIMHSSIPTSETIDIVYKVQVSDLQPAGDYETEIVYLAVPSF